jgi:phosphatidylserine decarboxylase
VNEAEIEDLSYYRCLGDFFKRSLKAGCRSIDDTAAVVSPSDGTVVHFGEVNEETVEQVKGVNYSLPAFLGPKSWPTMTPSSSNSSLESLSTFSSSSSLESLEREERNKRYHQKLLTSRNPDNTLYHCVIYLAPGDYHRFHSPAEWDIHYRRHFSGKLLSIRPSFMSWIEDLFTLNERVSYFGSWMYGFFSMTAVGATNVGSVRVYFDDELKTNRFLSRHGSFKDRSLINNPVRRAKGDPFGEFNLGSTLVLIFEAPKGLKCSVSAGDTIKYGQSLFFFDEQTSGNNSHQP